MHPEAGFGSCVVVVLGGPEDAGGEGIVGKISDDVDPWLVEGLGKVSEGGGFVLVLDFYVLVNPVGRRVIRRDIHILRLATA